MEAIGGGASVIAFITITIQSTKVIYKVLTGIEDGPQTVRTAASSVKGLQAALEQLAHRLIISDQLPPLEFQNQIRNCSADLGAFASKLTKFEALETDSRARKMWKRLMTVLSEKDLDRVIGAVGAHSSILTLSMNSLYGSNTQNLEMLRTEMAREQQQQISALSASFNQTSIANDSTRSSINQNLQVMASNLNESKQEMKMISESSQQMNDKLSHLVNAVQFLMNVTAPKTTPESHGLRPFEEEKSVDSCPSDALPPIPTNHAIMPLQRQTPAILLQDEKILDCINRLCGMMNEDEDKLDPETVDSVIEDLQTIIRAVKSQTKDPAKIRDLRRVSGLLGSAQTLSINGEAPRPLRPTELGRQEQRLETYEIGNGTLEVRTKHRYFQQHPKSSKATPKRQHSEPEYTISKLKFLPHSRKGAMFLSTILQQTSHVGSFSPIPFFQAALIRPRDSLVFQLVREGRLSEFIGLLRDGQASLSDHDDLGRPLIWIAACHHQPDMCRYLVEKHADPDVSCETNLKRTLPLIYFCLMNDDEEDENTVRRANECRKILLEEGADLTEFTSEGETMSAFHSAFSYCVVDSMRTFLDYSADFINIEWRDQWGRTPLLLCASLDRYSRESFEFLIGRGANIHAVDYHGRGCLYWCLKHMEFLTSSNIRILADGMAHLVRNGANVWAKDKLGETISHSAYSDDGQHITMRLSSHRRDMWDFALAVCGYDVMEVRGNFRRVGKYNDRYSWSDFQRLWSGYEAFCPYPDDLVKGPFCQCGGESDDDEHSHDSIHNEGETDDDEEIKDEHRHDSIDDEREADDDEESNDEHSHDSIDDGEHDDDEGSDDDRDVNDEEASEIQNSRQTGIGIQNTRYHSSEDDNPGGESDSDDSSIEESGSDDSFELQDFCCGRIHGNGIQCSRCGWSFRCRDPNCEPSLCSILRLWHERLNE